MTRDYVRRSTASEKSRRNSTRSAGRTTGSKSTARRSRTKQPNNPSIWSAPSFSAGVVFGAALILLASYAPSVFEETVATVRQQVTEPVEAIEFNFPDMLANDSVMVDPSTYDGQFADEDSDAPAIEFMIQVASLKSYGAASNLVAELDSSGLNARFERVVLDQVTWYRVMVGPFPGRQEANRVMTALRKRNNMGPGGPRLIKSG